MAGECTDVTLSSAIDPVGAGVICETWAWQAAVIPAKAGIHSANLRKCAVDGLDSRFRGNDQRFERDPIPNDTTTDPVNAEDLRDDVLESFDSKAGRCWNATDNTPRVDGARCRTVT
jgi:hypothetical protein